MEIDNNSKIVGEYLDYKVLMMTYEGFIQYKAQHPEDALSLNNTIRTTNTKRFSKTVNDLDSNGSRYLIVNKIGHIVCGLPNGLTAICEPSENIMRISATKGLWSFFNLSLGSLVSKHQFLKASDFHSGEAEITDLQNNKCRIDSKGNIYIYNEQISVKLNRHFCGGKVLNENYYYAITDAVSGDLFQINYPEHPIASMIQEPVLLRGWYAIYYHCTNECTFYFTGVRVDKQSKVCLNLETKNETRVAPNSELIADNSEYLLFVDKSYPNESISSNLIFRTGKSFISTSEIIPIGDNKGWILKLLGQNFGVVSISGQVILPFIYDSISIDNSNSLLRYTIKGINGTASLSGSIIHLTEKNECVTWTQGIIACEYLFDDLFILFKLAEGTETTIVCGMFDRSKNALVIPCEYSSLISITKSLFVVEKVFSRSYSYGKEALYGMVNRNGDTIIPIRHQEISTNDNGDVLVDGLTVFKMFREKLMRVVRCGDESGECCLIDAECIPQPHFYSEAAAWDKTAQDSSRFYDNLCIVKRGKFYGVIDVNMNSIIPFVYDSIYRIKGSYIHKKPLPRIFHLKKDNASFIYNLNTGLTSQIEFLDYDRMDFFLHRCDGVSEEIDPLLEVSSYTPSFKKGLLTLEGVALFPPKYSSISFVNKHFLLVSINDKSGIADYKGNLITEMVFSTIHVESNSDIVCYVGVLPITDIAVYDKEMNCLIPLGRKLRQVYLEQDGFYRVVDSDNKYYIINRSGSICCKEDYTYISEFDRGFASFAKGGERKKERNKLSHYYIYNNCVWGIMGVNGNTMLFSEYAFIRPPKEGYCVACKAFESSDPFKNSDYLYGVIDTSGQIIIPFSYTYIFDCNNGLFVVAEEGYFFNRGDDKNMLDVPDNYRWLRDAKWKIIDRNQKEVIQLHGHSILPPSEGVSIIVRDGRYGFFDFVNKFYVYPQYDYLDRFSDGLCVAGKMTNQADEVLLYGYINRENKLVFPFKYTVASAFQDGLAFPRKEGYGYVLHPDGHEEQLGEVPMDSIFDDDYYADINQSGLKDAFNGDPENYWNVD